MMKWIRRLARWVNDKLDPPCVVEVKAVRHRNRVKSKRAYDNSQSKTRDDILRALASNGPMTRVQLRAHLDVTSAGLHLPQMVQRGEIRIKPQTWPYIYEVVTSDGQ